MASPSSLPLLLPDLPSGVRLGQVAAASTPRISSGNEALDRLLEGGFPRGCLSEVSGPFSSGRTSLLYGLLASVTVRGEVAALVDGADRFDPVHAAAAGVVLSSLLWVRPSELRQAPRCCEILLGTRGFGLVALDLADGLPPSLAARWSSVWIRLAQRAGVSRAALVLLSDRRLAGGAARLSLSLSESRPLWPGHRLRGRIFGGIEAHVEVERSRAGLAGKGMRIRFDAAVAGRDRRAS